MKSRQVRKMKSASRESQVKVRSISRESEIGKLGIRGRRVGKFKSASRESKVGNSGK